MSGTKNSRRWGLFVGLGLAFGAIALGYLLQSPAKATLRAGDSTYHLTVVATQESRERGLSGRTGLAADEGMLFVYDKPQRVCMWMKDMNFPIDIVWLDAGKKVVYMSKEVSPDTYPASFCADEPTKYVVELTAGELAKRHIAVGQTLQL